MFVDTRLRDASLMVVCGVLTALVLFPALSQAYWFEGDKVVTEGTYYRIEQSPHTLTQFSQWATITATNKFSEAKQVDVALGFDTSVVRPLEAEYWLVNAPHVRKKFKQVNVGYTCQGNFTYQVEPHKEFWCWETNGSVRFSHHFKFGYPANKTAVWLEDAPDGTETVYYDDWVKLGSFSTHEYAGKTWFVKTGVWFNAGETKTMRVLVQATPSKRINVKYDLFLKLSSDSFAEAFASGRYLLLDPWVIVDNEYCRDVQINETVNTVRFYEPVYLKVDPASWTNKPYNNSIRVVNASCNSTGGEVAYEVCGSAFPGLCESPTYAGNNYTNVTLIFFVNSTAGQNQTYSIYYNSSGGSAPSYADKITVVNGTTTTITAQDLYEEIDYDQGEVQDFRSSWGDNADFCQDCFQEKNSVSGWVFENHADHVCYVLYDGIFYSDHLCPATENGNIARYQRVYAYGKATHLLFTQPSASFITMYPALNDGFAFYNASGLQSRTVSTNIIATQNWFDLYRSGGNTEGMGFFKQVYSGTNETNASYAVGGGSRSDLWADASGTHYNQTANWTGLFVMTGANASAAGAWFTRATYPLLSNVSGTEWTPAGPPASPNTSSLTVFCFDESTNASITCNLKTANSSTSNVAYDAYYLNASNVTGAITLTANKTAYYNRSYSITYSNASVNESFTAYLLNTSASAMFVRWHVQTSAGSPVSNASIIFYKDFGGGYVPIIYGTTDGFGLYSGYFDYTTSYYLTVSSTYGSYAGTVTPVQSDYYITLGGGSGGFGNTTYPYNSFCTQNVSQSLTPYSGYFFRQTGQDLVWTISSVDSQLDYWGWQVYWNNTLINSTNYSVAAGGVITLPIDFNASNATSNVSAFVFWYRNATSDCNASRVFWVTNVTGSTGLFGALSSLKDDTEIGNNALGLLALLITTAMVVYASRYTAAGGAVIGIVTVAFFTFIAGWLPAYFFMIVGFGGLVWAYFSFTRGF